MIPVPGEKASDWWANTSSEDARLAAARAGGYSEEFDLNVYFLDDIPRDVLATAPPEQPENGLSFEEPCPFSAMPAIPATVLAGLDDRFFPFEFQRRVSQERLGVDARPLPGGHLLAMSHPKPLVAELVSIAQNS